jgi:hypothetical protein
MTDLTETARAYRRRADAREAARLELYVARRQRAARLAAELHSAFGPQVRVYLLAAFSTSTASAPIPTSISPSKV